MLLGALPTHPAQYELSGAPASQAWSHEDLHAHLLRGDRVQCLRSAAGAGNSERISAAVQGLRIIGYVYQNNNKSPNQKKKRTKNTEGNQNCKALLVRRAVESEPNLKISNNFKFDQCICYAFVLAFRSRIALVKKKSQILKRMHFDPCRIEREHTRDSTYILWT